jgi:MFS family permease
MLGSRVTTIAYPMLVLYLTGSPVYAGFAVFAATAPSFLFYVPAGALVDRWDPRETMLFCEFFRGISIGAIVVVLVVYRHGVVFIICLAVVEEILEIFATLAERRCISMVVERDLASSASSQFEARTHGIVLIARPLGAFLFGLDHIVPFLADFVSFVFSCLMLFGIREKESNPYSKKPDGRLVVAEMLDGWKQLGKDRHVKASILLNSCMTFISQALILVFIAETKSQHLSSLAIGIVLACSGLGGVLGAIFGKSIDEAIAANFQFIGQFSRIKMRLCIWSFGLLVLAVSAPVAACRIPCMSLVMAVFGFSGAVGNVDLETHITQNVPQAMIARLESVLQLISFFMCAIGPAFGGFLAEFFGTGNAMWFLFFIAIALTVLVGRNAIKRIWEHEVRLTAR